MARARKNQRKNHGHFWRAEMGNWGKGNLLAHLDPAEDAAMMSRIKAEFEAKRAAAEQAAQSEQSE